MSLSAAMGRYQYLRAKSQWYVEAVRSWVMPGSAAGAFAKYLGLSSRWSLLIAVVVPAVVEAAGFLLGRFLWRGGGVEAEYTMARDRDPYKIEQLDLQRRTLEVERQMAGSLERLRAVAEKLPGRAD